MGSPGTVGNGLDLDAVQKVSNQGPPLVALQCWCLSHVAHLQEVKPTQVGEKYEGFKLGKDLLTSVQLPSSSLATL